MTFAEEPALADLLDAFKRMLQRSESSLAVDFRRYDRTNASFGDDIVESIGFSLDDAQFKSTYILQDSILYLAGVNKSGQGSKIFPQPESAGTEFAIEYQGLTIEELNHIAVTFNAMSPGVVRLMSVPVNGMSPTLIFNTDKFINGIIPRIEENVVKRIILQDDVLKSDYQGDGQGYSRLLGVAGKPGIQTDGNSFGIMAALPDNIILSADADLRDLLRSGFSSLLQNPIPEAPKDAITDIPMTRKVFQMFLENNSYYIV